MTNRPEQCEMLRSHLGQRKMIQDENLNYREKHRAPEILSMWVNIKTILLLKSL